MTRYSGEAGKKAELTDLCFDVEERSFPCTIFWHYQSTGLDFERCIVFWMLKARERLTASKRNSQKDNKNDQKLTERKATKSNSLQFNQVIISWEDYRFKQASKMETQTMQWF